MARPTFAFRLVTGAYKKGILPARGFGKLFDHTPTRLWGGKVVDVPTEAGPLTLAVRDHGVRQLLVFGYLRHEQIETTLVRKMAPRLTTVVDIGANVGWYSCLIAERGFPRGGVILAVEPNPATLPYLVANAARYDSIVVVAAAIGDNSDNTVFYMAESSDLSSASRQVGKSVIVPGTTLDELVALHDLGTVDFVKCDVEGGEMAVLRGARDLRNGELPPIWMLEADERFLLETGSSFDGLEEEVNSVREPVTKYVVGRSGKWSVLPHFVNLRGTGRVNVLVVPRTRIGIIGDLLS